MTAIEQVLLKPSQLVPHKHNIRAAVGDVTDLADSVRAKGVLQPLVVVPNGQPDRYVIIAGHRRHAAATLADVDTVPCVIRHDLTDEADQIAVMMVENGQRSDLTAIEEAGGVQLLLDLGDNPRRIADRTGMSLAKVRQRAKVAKLPEKVRAKITEHSITLTDAVFIAEHSTDENDADELERALGTRNWGVAKQAVTDREAERARQKKVRKQVEAEGIEVVTDWETHRTRRREATEKFGRILTFEVPWHERRGDDVTLAKDPESVSLVHIAQHPIAIVGAGKSSKEVLIIHTAAPPRPGTATPEAIDTHAPEIADEDEDHDGEDDDVFTTEQDYQRARHECELATKVRRQFVADQIKNGTLESTREWGQFLAQYAPYDSEGHPDYVEISFAALDNLFGGDPRPWMAIATPAALLRALVWVTVALETDANIAHPHGVGYLSTLQLRAAIGWLDLLERLGHVLSDTEIAQRAKLIELADDDAKADGGESDGED
ncbi:ParB/RepB/Spo0J family partition protein [Gordonia desulfuricans]|uniref:ParB/RepB/Spo0J family partition protein n=1 Tax=Gordonia desulfuricans TaxID=89051 RepID=A0A7K3LT60_9ACTN|nr:ParB/RepB/Spo0J family partition protein [Gordonia desulfuricans]NDK91429.1 ParB/RepB/Spo0J family partition protein [Gordonia desulfuricans]